MARVFRSGTQRRLRRYIEILRRQLPMLRARFHVQYLGVFGFVCPGDSPKEQ